MYEFGMLVIIIIAANAGGAWSPIGDVTTTMLWIGKKVTTGKLYCLFIYTIFIMYGGTNFYSLIP